MNRMNLDTEIPRIEYPREALEIRGRNKPDRILSPEEVDEPRRPVVKRFDLNTARILYDGGHERAANALLGCGPPDTLAAVCQAFESLLADLGALCRFQKTAVHDVKSCMHYRNGWMGAIRQRRAADGPNRALKPRSPAAAMARSPGIEDQMIRCCPTTLPQQTHRGSSLGTDC